MKLIIVQRSKIATFRRLKETFADDLNVEVVFERRVRERRQRSNQRGPERRAQNRRRWSKAWNSRDYIVIQIAEPR
jgi:hypothetical protein